MKKRVGITILVISLILLITSIVVLNQGNNEEVKTVKSEDELLKLYDGEYRTSERNNPLINIVTMPFSFFVNGLTRSFSSGIYYNDYLDYATEAATSVRDASSAQSATWDSISVNTKTSSTSEAGSSSKDYSTTNIQVENVDEADIIKTDGDYIYSISGNKVVITDVRKPEDIKVTATIPYSDGSAPEDIILNKNQLIVISAKNTTTSYYSSKGTTIVRVYDTTTIERPTMVKQYELNQPYYTSRCINNQLFVISCGYLRKENNKVLRAYREDGVEKEIALNDIKYLKDIKTTKQTIISSLDLSNAKSDVSISSYLIDISNAYVSENSIYLLEQKYEYSSRSYVPPILSLFGPKGILGVFSYYDENDYDSSASGYKTQIFKFDITKDGKIEYATNTKVDGKTINQYSLDEKDGHLRVALYENNNGAKVVILNEKLDVIGESDKVGKNESMYSSRFMGDKVYVVTYRNTDPLYVIDLSDEAKPKVLGELHIPGYSTYLHPYDETHLIGIGMQTEETVRRDSQGRVLSTTSTIIGMKMALFDVSDVNNPVQISETVIGDRRTTSAILTNPKALLFSKAKELIAIPVNNYSEDVDMGTDSESYSTSISTYTNYSKQYIAEGYLVYKINLTDGFKLKGTITHEKATTSGYYSYYTTSKLLRGLYIDDNLYTVSETAVKVNKLDTLEQISELKLGK